MTSRKYLFIMLFALSTTLFAQQKAFQFGFKGGVNMGWFSTDAQEYNNDGVDLGGSWGFVADIFLMDNYSLTTGFDVIYLNSSLSYPDQKSHSVSSEVIEGMTSSKYKTKYLELPLIFTMRTNQLGKVKYYAQIGLGIGFLLSAKADESFISDDGNTQGSETLNTYEDFRFTRESFIVGAGVEIPIQGSTYIRTGIKFDNAFINVLKGYNTVDSGLKNHGRNSFIEFNVALFF